MQLHEHFTHINRGEEDQIRISLLIYIEVLFDKIRSKYPTCYKCYICDIANEVFTKVISISNVEGSLSWAHLCPALWPVVL